MEWFKKYGLAIGIGVFVWLIGFMLLVNNNKKIDDESVVAISEPVEEKKEEVKVTKEDKILKVDIKGSVKKPGVYEVKENTVVNDVIALAGGLKSGATTKNINLSKKVKDEMVIYIYTSSELKKFTNNQVECNCDDVVISSCEGASIIYNEPSNNNDESVLGTTLININTAGINELMTLSGVGEAKAKAIIEYREKNGSFKSIEDIKNVSGIGEAAYQKIKDYITV
jgi:competence protein ComEA